MDRSANPPANPKTDTDMFAAAADLAAKFLFNLLHAGSHIGELRHVKIADITFDAKAGAATIPPQVPLFPEV